MLYQNMADECGKFFISAHSSETGEKVASEEIRGAYHKNGKWSYTEISILADDQAVLLCETRSTHFNSNHILYLVKGERSVAFGKRSTIVAMAPEEFARKCAQLPVSVGVAEKIILSVFTPEQRGLYERLRGEKRA